ncbi:MAG: universal stress protein [Gammaproteobacteria bacterium]|nr:universal stress protein [Pseudomonadota bacterium]MCZ6537917.1 universal stress protein [Gammaproteobacteria bacterium]MCZ6687213.1 universal stress protein [Gammaproteobacteria bacterium]MCZ6763161.1 universal stress protein [Gammaproteobacteria bacterium]MCZ6880123.1 universal stress protein [Gammaproteobacteria bacterium]
MSGYRKILLAVDLSDDSEIIGKRAVDMANRYQAEICLVHVVEYVPVEPMGEALLPSVQIEDELVKSAKTRFEALADSLGLGEAPRYVEVGNIKAEVIRVARDQECDLIVLGCRERHGLAIIINFTEDTMLHAAPCDVLAVRLGQKDS